jgi:uncharacterized membrane protein YhaH (DUF805 family)
MANPILRGFRNIARFSGRDGRGQFWPYAGVVVLAVFVFAAVALPLSMQGLFAEMEAFAVAHPEAATVHSSPGSYSIAIDAGHPLAPSPDLSGFFLTLTIMVILAVVLLAAAVSRRLHDCNRSALFGLVPVAFLAGGLILMSRLLASVSGAGEPNLALFGLLFANNALYMAALLALIVQCALEGRPGPNRYGPKP